MEATFMLVFGYADEVGYNGQMKSDEVYGIGNLNTAKYWEMDTRIARRWNLDPKPVPWESEYAVNRGNPILGKDPDGDDTVSDISCDLKHLNVL